MSSGISSLYFCRRCDVPYTTPENDSEGYCLKCQCRTSERATKALVVGDVWEGRGNVVRITNADRRYVSYCSDDDAAVGHTTKEAFRRRFKPVVTADTPVSRSR